MDPPSSDQVKLAALRAAADAATRWRLLWTRYLEAEAWRDRSIVAAIEAGASPAELRDACGISDIHAIARGAAGRR